MSEIDEQIMRYFDIKRVSLKFTAITIILWVINEIIVCKLFCADFFMTIMFILCVNVFHEFSKINISTLSWGGHIKAEADPDIY